MVTVDKAQCRNQRTLDGKTEACILVGLIPTGYVLECLASGKRIHSCHVTFLKPEVGNVTLDITGELAEKSDATDSGD
jgi:hypothetical protein